MKQRTAHWIQKTHLFRSDEYICSACNYKAKKAERLCPGCSSIMKNCKYNPNWVDEIEMAELLFHEEIQILATEQGNKED